MFVQLIRKAFPKVRVTETHPKALLKALRLTGRAFGKRFGVEIKMGKQHEHERDAVISAVVARQGFMGLWKKDLVKDRHGSEQAPSLYGLPSIHYFWPEE
jgi:predicted nuclease with RNAse H fold